jgi:hypothetical protein
MYGRFALFRPRRESADRPAEAAPKPAVSNAAVDAAMEADRVPVAAAGSASHPAESIAPAVASVAHATEALPRAPEQSSRAVDSTALSTLAPGATPSLKPGVA